ncbi:MAG: tripartite tricarboxylate transporter permease [Nanoarchaeota archaeon]
MLDIILALLFGILCGIITGITPGLHVNTVAALLLAGLPLLTAHFSLLALGVFLIAMLISHSFHDYIPSIFLGAPDEGETALAVLPGHKMLMRGEGYKALKLTVAGGIGAYLIGLVSLPLFFLFVKHGYSYLEYFIVPIIISLTVFFILSEAKLKKVVWALVVFLLSGILGLLALNNLPLREPLFPLLAGLFGISGLLLSTQNTNTIPVQKFESDFYIGNILTHIKGVVCSALMNVLPALGSAQATILAQTFSRKQSGEEFLTITGGISTVSVLFILTTLFLINKARSGVIAIMKQFLTIGDYEFLVLIAASFASVGFSVFLVMVLGKYFANKIGKIKYRELSIGIILFIIALVGLFSGWLGWLVLSVSTAIGLIAPKVGIKRIHAMGCLVIPVVAYFL